MAKPNINPDYFRLDDELTDREIKFRDAVRGFVNDTLLPVVNSYWQREEFPSEVLPELAKLGVIGANITGYGCPGLSRRGAGVVAREMARGDGSLNSFLGVHANLAMGSINVLGSEEQKSRWLPAMARLEKTGAFALTEPTHGSDSVSLETRARRVGSEWILTGHKRWIGNGHTADIVVIYARDEADGQVKPFVMEKNDNGTYPKGYDATPILGKMGKRSIVQADIIIDELRIPHPNKLVDGNSFADVNRVLATTRGSASWEATGHGMAAFEIAANYSLEREQFGRQIGGFQLVQYKLANMLAELTNMQLLCQRMAQLQEEGQLSGAMASLVKMSTAQKGKAICAEARDILGGNGLLLEHHIVRHLTDMEVLGTYEGTDSIQALIIGRDITGLSAFAR